VTRTLYLLRHAKSSWQDATVPDRDRPLAPRGYRACELLTEHLRSHEITPALVLCSSSTRTRQTLERVSAGFSRPVEALIEDALYGATAAELLDRLGTVDDAVASVMLIGHNPGIQELAVGLVRIGLHREALSGKFPTGALATLQLTSSWTGLVPGSATCTGFVTPAELTARRES
jgi:phosphohistidine phosphatase